MRLQISQADFDILLVNAVMWADLPQVNANAEFTRVCEAHAESHKHETFEELVASLDELGPTIQHCVDRICGLVYGPKDLYRPEHRIAVLRLMLNALHQLHGLEGRSMWSALFRSLARVKPVAHGVRIDRAGANIEKACTMVLYKNTRPAASQSPPRRPRQRIPFHALNSLSRGRQASLANPVFGRR